MLLATIGALVLVFVGEGIRNGAGLGDADDEAERLILRAEEFEQVLTGAIIAGLGLVLLAAPLYFLFAATRVRAERPLARLGPLVLIGAPLIGIGSVLSTLALDSVATDFVAGEPTTGEEGIQRAEDMTSDSTFYGISTGLQFAGVLGFAFSAVYTGLHAMRNGLLTRFWGTLGMAFAVAFGLSFIFGPLGFFGLILWLVHVALVANGRWFGSRPPAWEAGIAVPWPAPGESAPREPDPGEEPARPEDFGVTAEEDDDRDGGRPGRRENRRKRKRKQRRR